MRFDTPLPARESDALVAEVISEFLVGCRLRNASARMVQWYEETLHRVLAPLLAAPLPAVTLKDIRARIADLLTGRASSTVNGFVQGVKAFLNWAEQEEFVVSVDPRKISRLKEPVRLPPTLTATGSGSCSPLLIDAHSLGSETTPLCP